MNPSRPTVDPAVLVAAIDGAPDRVRRRLDRDPDAASGWQWTPGDDGWTVAAGNETVHLPADHIGELGQLSCSCLLSPNCFHIMACLTALEVAAEQNESHLDDAPIADVQEPSSEVDTVTVPDERQQRAAADLTNNINRLISVGISGAGVAVQSGLMRAVHQCRAQGLHRAAAVGLRVIEGTGQVRRRASQSDPTQLAEDITDCVETSHHIRSGKPIEDFWIGTARRKQRAVRPKRLHGLLAEPILTRSGYGGVAVYFLGEDDQVYSVSDVRPGGAELCRGAYRGGIDIGPIVEPAIKLARSQYLGSELTASRDGRLGRGQSVKIASQGASDWHSHAIQRRFDIQLTDQWDRIYQQTAFPPDVRPAGWDLVFISGSIVGAAGAELLLKEEREQEFIRLAIANDTEELCFRENLRILSHAPGLKLKLIGRLELNQPTTVQPLAMVVDESAASEPSKEKLARLELPDELAGRVFLGLDPIARHYLLDAKAKPLVVGDAADRAPIDLLAPLRRRWVAMMLAGSSSQHRTVTNTIAAEIASLHRSGFTTGASLLDAMARRDEKGVETFLATGIYLRRCASELAKSQATLK